MVAVSGLWAFRGADMLLLSSFDVDSDGGLVLVDSFDKAVSVLFQ